MIQPSRRGLAIVLGLLAAAPSLGALPDVIERALHAQGIPATAISIQVSDAATGVVELAANAHEPRSPASTLKVLTTAAALDQLGPAYHWTTRVLATGPVHDGRLRGDLVLQGGGDPFLTAERWWQLARELRDTGLRRIDGDVIVDHSLYAVQDEVPDAFDGRGDRSYNVLPDALLVNLQSAEFHFVPEGGRVAIVVDPELANLDLANALRLLPGHCRAGLRAVRFVAGTRPEQLTVTGQVGAQCPPAAIRRAVMDAPAFAYGSFAANWRDLGGTLAGGLRVEPTPAGTHVLTEYPSLSLGEVVRLVNKHSNNAMARMLLLTLAVERFGAPATVGNGDRAVREWLAGHGLELPELSLDNGSGLSRTARISAAGMSRVLGLAYRSSYYPELAASLPLGGQDGTLLHRFTGLAADGRIRLKTGHLDGVGAVAGWVTPASGRTLSVVVLINHPGAQYASGHAVIDAVVRWALAH